MTKQQLAEGKRKIEAMTHVEMAHLYRYAPSGHIYFNTRFPLHEVFNKRFEKLGGMTTAISKIIDEEHGQ